MKYKNFSKNSNILLCQELYLNLSETETVKLLNWFIFKTNLLSEISKTN